jgi:CubicO group peptidase (beta-lactamase class C family)
VGGAGGQDRLAHDGSREAELIEAYLDGYAESYLDSEGAGFALAVLGPDGVVIEKVHGMAVLEDSIPISADTSFDLASVSKMFAAMAVLILYEDGELELDDPITGFFPEGPAAWDAITVHHLLTHQSGFPEFATLQGWTNQQILDWLLDEPLEGGPGERYLYSNANYTTLALVVERVAEQPFERFMKERIFNPLGMESSEVVPHWPPDVEGGAVSYLGSMPLTFPSRATGATQQYSSIRDLERWEAELRDPTLVSTETLELGLTGHVARNDGCEYGYGWVICEDNGAWPYHQNHNGLIHGFRTMFFRVPSHGLAVMMASNGAFEGAYLALMWNVARLYLEGVIWQENTAP